MKTTKYKVCVTNGVYNAPSIIVMSVDEKGAIKEAKEQSGLSRFPEAWQFIATKSDWQ